MLLKFLFLTTGFFCFRFFGTVFLSRGSGCPWTWQFHCNFQSGVTSVCYYVWLWLDPSAIFEYQEIFLQRAWKQAIFKQSQQRGFQNSMHRDRITDTIACEASNSIYSSYTCSERIQLHESVRKITSGNENHFQAILGRILPH